jgi:hypothetical protein
VATTVLRTRLGRAQGALEAPIAYAYLENAVLDGVIGLLRGTYHGQITIVLQNFRVVQVERKENFNPEELEGTPLGLTPGGFNPKAVRDKIVKALVGLEFGQIILVVKKGKLAQLERLQKERFSDLQGLGGDGI